MALSALGAVAPSVVGPVRAQSASAPAERQEGILTVLWGHSQDHTGPEDIRFTLNTTDGRRVQLDVPPSLTSEAVRLANKPASVTGSTTETAVGGERLSATAIEAFPTAGVDAEPQAVVSGRKKVLFVLLKFKGDDQEPFKPGFFRDLTNPLKGSGKIPATINGVYDAVSYGKLRWEGAVAGGKWYVLPKPQSDYCSGAGVNGPCDIHRIADDAVKLIKGDVDIKAFDNLSFAFNNDIGCCAWGGGYSNGTRSWGATWDPPWAQQVSTYVHELGHSLGLPHSGWVYYAYDNQHDEMSRGSVAKRVQCATYNSINSGSKTPIYCHEPGGGFNMAYQDHLGWIPKANKAVHDKVGTKVYDIQANAKPLGGALKMVKFCITGSPCTSADKSGRYFTIEVKTKSQKYDHAVPSEGVVVYDMLMNRNPVSGKCFFNSSSGWAMPFDSSYPDYDQNTCSGPALTNMPYRPGQSLVIDQFGVKIDVLSRKNDIYKVRVTKTK